jgi:hypothetical protein
MIAKIRSERDVKRRLMLSFYEFMTAYRRGRQRGGVYGRVCVGFGCGWCFSGIKSITNWGKKKGAALYNAQKVLFYSKHVLTYK